MANTSTTSTIPSFEPPDIFLSGDPRSVGALTRFQPFCVRNAGLPPISRCPFDKYSAHSELIVSSSLETTRPFPQRWGLLRKGRAVFRREDRVDRLRSSTRRSQNQFSGRGGGACSKCFIPCLPGPPCVTV